MSSGFIKESSYAITAYYWYNSKPNPYQKVVFKWNVYSEEWENY